MDSVSATVQYEIGALLEQAGARPRGNRHDCPKCRGVRTVTHTPVCFYCHKCQWKGNAFTLAKELGVYRRIPPGEYCELQRRRGRAHEAALRLYAVVRFRQLELREVLREFGRLESAAHDAGAADLKAWEVLSRIYTQRPGIEAELSALEQGNGAQVFAIIRGEVI